MHRLRDGVTPLHLFQLGAESFAPVLGGDVQPGNLSPSLSSFVGRRRRAGHGHESGRVAAVGVADRRGDHTRSSPAGCAIFLAAAAEPGAHAAAEGAQLSDEDTVRLCRDLVTTLRSTTSSA